MVGVLIMIFVKVDLFEEISDIKTDAVKTGKY